MKTLQRLVLVVLTLCLVLLCTSALAYNTGDDYPQEYKAVAKNSQYDKWNFAVRNCTSFVAWCLNSRNNVSFTNQYGGVSYWGNASNWANVARSLGILVDSTPAVGAVAYVKNHVGWVKEVNGTQVVTEEYNHNSDGLFHTQTKDVSYWEGYIHIADIPQGKAVTTSVIGCGSITGLASGTQVPEGNSVTLTAVPQENYAFTKWHITYMGPTSLLDLSLTSTKNPFTFTMPGKGVSVCAEFTRQPSSSVWEWQDLSVNSVTESDASLGAKFYYGLPLAKMTTSLSGKFYLYVGTDLNAVTNAAPGASSGVTAISLGSKSGVSFNFVDYTFSLSVPSVSLASVANSPFSPLRMSAGTTFYYKWTAVLDGVTMHSAVSSGRTLNGSSTWSNLRTNGLGLFSGQVNWRRDLVMQEAGCFVSSDYNTVSGATYNNANGAAIRKDTGNFPTSSSLSTSDTYGCIVFYKGPSFDSISSFTPGVTYYYKFYGLTNDGKASYSDIAQYTPASSTTELTNVWMVPGDNRTVTVGTTLTVEFGSNVAATCYYAHICDRNTNVDTCEAVARNVTSGSTTYTFNTVGNYYIYIGAAYNSKDLASEVVYVDVVPADQEKPVVSGWIDHVTHEGYDVHVTGTDNTGVTAFRIGTWHDKMHVDNAIWQEITNVEGDQVTFHVSTADFGNTIDTYYHTNIYAYDAAGNHNDEYRAGDPYIEATPPIFTEGWIENNTAVGFDVVAFGEDDHELAYFVFGVWNDNISANNAQWTTVKQENGSATLNVSIESFDSVTDTTYHVMIIPFDICNNPGESAEGEIYLDGTPPEITNLYVELTLYEGYDVVCDASDDIGVAYYVFGTWNDNSDILSAVWETLTPDEGSVRYTVPFDRFDNETGVVYHTMVIPFDWSNNQGEAVTLDVDVPMRDMYTEKDDAMTLYLPSGTVEIGEEAFAFVKAQYFVLPSTVRSIGSLAFPQGSVVYVYNASSITIPKDAIANGGTFVEMTDNYSSSLYRKLFGTESNYVMRNGKSSYNGGLIQEEELVFGDFQ